MNTPADQWQLQKQEEGEDLKIFTTRFDHYLNLRNSTQLKATVLSSNDSVNVVALTPDQHIILVQQYRFGTRSNTLELPGGFVDDGEDKLAAAKRELQEETGYSGSQWSYLGSIGNNPAFMDSNIHHYLLEDARLIGETKLDDGENVAVVKLSLNELKTLLLANEIRHPHTTSGLSMVFNVYQGRSL